MGSHSFNNPTGRCSVSLISFTVEEGNGGESLWEVKEEDFVIKFHYDMYERFVGKTYQVTCRVK